MECAIANTPMTGWLEIQYQPDKELLEFDSFDLWVEKLAEQSGTAESLSVLLYETLDELLKPVNLSVKVCVIEASHAPVVVEVG